MNWRIVIAFIVAPPLPCALVAVVMSAPALSWNSIQSSFQLLLMFALPFPMLIGMPVYFFLKRYRKIGLLECVLGGAAIGILFGIIGIFVGATSGLIFWVLAISPKPKSCEATEP